MTDKNSFDKFIKNMTIMIETATLRKELTSHITTEVENGVNIQAWTSFINMPAFRFKSEEDK